MSLNAATKDWINRQVGGLLRGELPSPLGFLLGKRAAITTEGEAKPDAPAPEHPAEPAPEPEPTPEG